MIIPTLSDGTAFYSQRTTLDGVDYQLEFRWSVRESRWYLNLYDALETPLILGMKLQTNWPLTKYYKGRVGVPQGDLMVISLGVADDPPGLQDLGAGLRCELHYFPPGS